MTTSTTPTRILATVDFGEASASAVALAGILAEGLGATLTVLHAETMETPPYFTDDQIEALRTERREARARASEYVRQFAAQHTQAPLEVVVQDGPPEDTIIRAIDAFDLVVLGTHGRRGPSRWWLGSVAEAVVRAAPVPVLVTRVLEATAIGRLTRGGAVVLAGSPAAGVERWASALGQALNAEVVRVPGIRSCPPERLGSADLVLVGIPGASASVDDVVVEVLQSCSRPILFVPARGPSQAGRLASPQGDKR